MGWAVVGGGNRPPGKGMWAACSGTRAVSLGAAAGVVILWRGMWEMCEASARFLPRGVYYREKYGIKVRCSSVLPVPGVVHPWVGQIVTFFAYRPPSRPQGSLTPTQPGRVTDTLRLEGLRQPPVSAAMC